MPNDTNGDDDKTTEKMPLWAWILIGVMAFIIVGLIVWLVVSYTRKPKNGVPTIETPVVISQ